jgi:sugar lactone lactonase YvrE
MHTIRIRRCLFLLLAIVFLPIQARALQPGDVLGETSSPGCCPMGATFDGKSLWIADRKANKLFRIDPLSGKVLGELPTPGLRTTGLTWDGRHLWIADRDELEIFRLDPKTGIVDRVFKVGIKAPRGMAWDGECLYLASGKDDVINCLDPDDGTLMRKFPAPANAVTGLTFDGKYLWAADRDKDELYRIDPREGHVIGILKSPGPQPFGLAWDGKHLWNVDYQSHKIYVLNVTKGASVLRLEEKSLRIDYTIHFQNQGPDPISQADFYIAVPEKRYNQDIIRGPCFSAPDVDYFTNRWSQKVAHLHRSDIQAGKSLEFSMSLDTKLYRTSFWIQPDKVRPLGTVPKSIRKNYLANNSKYRLNNPAVRSAVRLAIGSETNPYWIARKIYQFVLEKLDYKLSGGWDPVPLLLERGTGSCSEYSFVLIALCRAAGIPARYVGGVVTRGDDAFVDNVFHRWVEIYLPGYGWIPVDPDRGDKKTPRGQALGFGNQENTLLVTTVSGGESKYLGWKYNGNVTWSFKGRTRAYVEHVGELSPIDGNSNTSPVINVPASNEAPQPKKPVKKKTSTKQP